MTSSCFHFLQETHTNETEKCDTESHNNATNVKSGRGDRGGKQIDRQVRHCVTISRPFFVSCKSVPIYNQELSIICNQLQIFNASVIVLNLPQSMYAAPTILFSGVGFLVHCKGVHGIGQTDEELKRTNEVSVLRRKIRKILRSP